MTSQPTCALATSILYLALASGCTPVQPVVLSHYTTSPVIIPSQHARVRHVYCVTAPVGYVVPQDKWDPYLIPCPVPPTAVAAPSDGASERPGPVDPDRPTLPPSPRPEPPKPAHESSSAGDASTSITRNGDGTTTESSTAGGARATVTY